MTIGQAMKTHVLRVGLAGREWHGMKLDMRHVLFFSSLGDCNKGSKQQKSRAGSHKRQEKPGQEKAAGGGGDMYPLPFQAMDPQQCSPLMV